MVFVFCQQVAERRPQPQVLVPLRTGGLSRFTSQPSVTSKMQQVQQRACALTASVKGAQTVVSSVNQRRPDLQRAAPCVQMTKNPQPVQNGNAKLSRMNVECHTSKLTLFVFIKRHSLRKLLASGDGFHRSRQQLAPNPVKGHLSRRCKFKCCDYSFNTHRTSADKCRRPGKRKLPPASGPCHATMPHSVNCSYSCTDPQTCSDAGLSSSSLCFGVF